MIPGTACHAQPKSHFQRPSWHIAVRPQYSYWQPTGMLPHAVPALGACLGQLGIG